MNKTDVAEKIINELNEIKDISLEQSNALSESISCVLILVRQLNHKPTWLRLLNEINPTIDLRTHINTMCYMDESKMRNDELTTEESKQVEMFFGTMTSIISQRAKASQLFDKTIRNALKFSIDGTHSFDRNFLSRLLGIMSTQHPYFTLIRDLATEQPDY